MAMALVVVGLTTGTMVAMIVEAKVSTPLTLMVAFKGPAMIGGTVMVQGTTSIVEAPIKEGVPGTQAAPRFKEITGEGPKPYPRISRTVPGAALAI